MSLFAIADLHLSLSSDKSMDVFPGWEDYVQRIEKNWKSVVKQDDTVVIVGDISWAMKLNQAFEDMNFLNSLPGDKLFIKGNHDLWWSTRKKVETYFEANGFNTLKLLFNDAYPVGDVGVCGTRGWFYDHWDDDAKKIVSREANRLTRSIKDALKMELEPIAFLHYPPVYNNQECSEILEVLKKYKIKKCYYGHVHGADAYKNTLIGEYKGINFQFISCDYTGFRPILVR